MIFFVNYRMELCGSQSEDTFLTIHHEMGHIEYYMAYANQPVLFRVKVETERLRNK